MSDDNSGSHDKFTKQSKGDSHNFNYEDASDKKVVGMNGLGRVWTPNNDDVNDSDEDSDFDSHNNEDTTSKKALDVMKMQSIGFDPTKLFRQRMERQIEDDCLSDEEDQEDEKLSDDEHEDDFDQFEYTPTNVNEDGSLIAGRQAGVDVVKEMKMICLEHETTSPIENLRIELNSFKFSQNASFSDCVTGAMLAIFERIHLTPDISAGKLVANFKNELSHWSELLEKLCHSVEEEMSLIVAVETAATSGGVVGEVLSHEPSFRFILQTLHSEEVVSDEAIMSWATMRREEDNTESPRGKLFLQAPTQEFLDWIEEDSSGSEEDGSDDSDSDSD
jgi:eIF4-gamma/eIF5/eIF2-epsilon.